MGVPIPAAALVALIVFLALLWAAIWLERSSGHREAKLDLTGTRQFRPKRVFFAIAAAGYAMVGLPIILVSSFPASSCGEWIVFCGAALVIAVMVTFGVITVTRAYFIVAEEYVEFRYGRAAKRIPLTAIREIRISNGFIVIDAGSVPRAVVPAIFDNGEILSLTMLRLRRAAD